MQQPDDLQGASGRAVKNFALLALPVLAAQRDMLGILKNNLKDGNCVLPVQNFALRELYALMMVFDPSRKWRDTFSGLEEKIGTASKEAIPKLVSGSMAMIEAQEAVIGSMIDTLTRLKNATGQSKQDDDTAP
ncbi:MAG: hypothetical protein ACTHLO_01095 [Pseudolabrys sp.]